MYVGIMFLNIQDEALLAPTVADLDSSRGCSAAFLQLRDLSLAAAGGRLQGMDLVHLLDELRDYLQGQELRFASYSKALEHPPFLEALGQISTGLIEMRDLVEEALEVHPQMSAPDWASLLEDAGAAEDQLRLGVELLDLVGGE
jgi:hypothetical protein